MSGEQASRSRMTGRRLRIETPELVVLEVELAGLGSRAAAFGIDLLVIVLISVLLWLGTGAFGMWGWADSWIVAASIVLAFAVPWGYFTLFEGLTDGRTPGKRRLGLRVIRDSGLPVTLGPAAVRNLVRIVDAQPGVSFLVGLLFVLLHRQAKRLGDLAAGTVVVRDQPYDVVSRPGQDSRTVAEPAPAVPEPVAAALLTDDEFRVLQQLVSRAEQLDADRRLQLQRSVAARIADRYPISNRNLQTGLADVLQRERVARQSRFAAVTRAKPGRTSVPADRFVAARRPVWVEFQERVRALRAGGLRGLDGDEVLAFTARYREVAADLARARTYGCDARDIGFLERIVSGGHNLLYRGHETERRPWTWWLLRDLPAAVYRARRVVLAASVIFFVPGVIGFVMIRGAPELAYDVIPDGMIARAESGADRIAGGQGYAESPDMFLPVVASSIIANNIQVAFVAFAFGITAGVGTGVVLAFNGLFFGAILGLFANYDLLGWILTFVAGHGVLELFAIFVAGGAGLHVGAALIAPGDARRRDALAARSPLAIRLVAVATLLLLVAGIVEGFLSASGAPAGFKFAVAGLSGLLVALVFAAGHRRDHESAGADPPDRELSARRTAR